MFGLGRSREPAGNGQWLDCDGEPVWLAWKPHPKARRLKLLMAADGPRLTLPPRTSHRAAEMFVHQHRDWLAQQWQKRQAHVLLPLQIGEPAQLPWLGQRLPIAWIEDRALRVVRHADHWRIHTGARSSDAQLRAALLQEYRHAGKVWWLGVMQGYLSDLPKAPSALRVKPLKSLWGSLNAADAVTLDVALLFAPPQVADYVLVHELCHLLQRNHSPRFWREVENRFPHWRDQRDYLKQHGTGLKAEARRLFLNWDGGH